MAITISAARIKTFEQAVLHLAQQRDSRLRDKCQERNLKSSSHSFKRIGVQALAAKAGPRTATPVNDTPWSNRVAIPAAYDGGDTFEPEDVVQMLADPGSQLVQSFSYAVNRMYDDVIITATDANALDEAGVSNVFPAGQYFLGSGGVAYGDEISMKQITAIGAIFNTNEVPPEEVKYAIVGPLQVQKLSHEDKLGNSLYREQLGALANKGFVRDWLGFTWIMSNRLIKPAPGQIKCIFMTGKAMGLLVPENLFLRVEEDPSMSFLTRVYAKITTGAVRVMDEHIVVAKLANTCTIS